MSTFSYSDLANYASTICQTTTFSACSLSDGSTTPLVNEAQCSNVFGFDQHLVKHFCDSFAPGAADSVQFADKCVNFVEFKNHKNTQYSTFAEFFNNARLFKQLDESLLFFENCFLPSFSASTGVAITRQSLVVNFYIVAQLATSPLQVSLSIMSRIASLPTDPCISKYQKTDINSNHCFYNQIKLLTPQLFDLLFYRLNP